MPEKGKICICSKRKDVQSLSEHGLTIADAKSAILTLSAKDYYKGPKRDFESAQSRDIWEFKKRVNGLQFYVKLKIQKRNGEKVLKCLSFHENDYG